MNTEDEDSTKASPTPSPIFATTRWTVVLNAGDAASTEQSEALAQLCRTYWYPLYAFIRRQGASGTTWTRWTATRATSHPDWKISEIDLLSGKGKASYMLVAITLE